MPSHPARHRRRRVLRGSPPSPAIRFRANAAQLCCTGQRLHCVARAVQTVAPRSVNAEPHALDSTSWVGYRLCEILPVPLAAKQKLLELQGAITRLQILYRFLEQRGLVGRR